MRSIPLVVLLLLATPALAQDPGMPAATPQHAWLGRLVGTWNFTATANMGPDVEPMVAEGTETVTKLGDLWIVSAASLDFQGMTFGARLQLGYDPAKERFVGTWIDSMQPYMWTYVGELDEAKRTLTLRTEGPRMGDPTDIAQYREVIEITGPDTRTFSSSIRNEDGTWTTFMQSAYRRAKSAPATTQPK